MRARWWVGWEVVCCQCWDIAWIENEVEGWHCCWISGVRRAIAVVARTRMVLTMETRGVAPMVWMAMKVENKMAKMFQMVVVKRTVVWMELAVQGMA